MPLVKRGLKVRLVTDSKIYLEKVRVRLHKPVLAVDVLVDDKEALISLPDFSACGWVENPAIARHFKEFIELLWRSSKKSKPASRKKIITFYFSKNSTKVFWALESNSIRISFGISRRP